MYDKGIVYSEVYSILQLLGKEYIDKLPKDIYRIIERKRTENYNLQFNSIADINEKNIQKEALAMIATFHIKYWCKSEEEKDNLKKIFNENSIKNNFERRNKYNPDYIFDKNKTTKERVIEKFDEVKMNEEVSLICKNKENFLNKFLNKIKKFFYEKKN